MIKKIEKLLRLSESPNIHEAALALQKATELMKLHAIELNQLNQNPNGISTSFYVLPHGGRPWTKTLASRIVASFNGSSVFSKNFPGFRNKPSVKFFAVDTKTITLMLEFAFQTIDKLANKELKRIRMSSVNSSNISYVLRYMNSFRLGIADELNKTLALILASNSAECQDKSEYGLILLDDKAKTEEVFRETHPDVVITKLSSTYSDASGFNRGRKVAENITFHKQVNRKTRLALA